MFKTYCFLHPFAFEPGCQHCDAERACSDAKPAAQGTGRSRGVSGRSGGRPDPTCVHCGIRCTDLAELDKHLRFQCEALGRQEQAT